MSHALLSWGFVHDDLRSSTLNAWIFPDASAAVILITIAHIYGGRSMNDKPVKIEMVTLKQLCSELKVDPAGLLGPRICLNRSMHGPNISGINPARLRSCRIGYLHPTF